MTRPDRNKAAMTETVDLSDPRSSHRLWLVVAAWSAIAVVNALILRADQAVPLRFGLQSALVWAYALGTLVWIACWLDLRYEIWKRTIPRALLIHAGMGVIALAVWAAVVVAFHRVRVGPDFWRVVFQHWMFQLLSTVMTYAASVGIGLAAQSRDRERERRQRELRLEVLAREAELTAIKAQLQPHFLFNALNSIMALVEQDPPEARRMLIRLASLLHSVFDRMDEPAVPLERELETIRDYLEIERIRFGDRISFHIDADGAARQLPVPPFLLQPIVENAVKHGIEPHAHPGTVTVTGQRDGDRLRLSVADTGGGINGSTSGHGRGLELTRRRLSTAYGDDATLSTERRQDLFTVTLDLPVASDAI
jgi:two-component system, LytTR family, sensor kinase